MTRDRTGGPRELLGMYADQVSDYAWREYDRWLPHGKASPEAIAALRAVLDLHQPREDGGHFAIPDGVVQCGHCADNCHDHYSGLYCEHPADAVWPCPTVRAITDALRGDPDAG
jgi:hypothetical protein